MTQVSQNTATVKLNRNERRKLQRAAKKNGVQTIESIASTVEGILGDHLDGGKQIDGTVNSSAQGIEGAETKEPVETKEVKESTSDRGLTTKIIREMMESKDGTTREAIIAKLVETFPGKDIKAIKNTVGALMHVIPVRMNWVVEKTQIDPADKRKINFKVVGFKEAEKVEETAAA